jgi:predicted kinase
MPDKSTTVNRRPLLVLIGGAPAIGKTTLSRYLSEKLAVPVISKDMIRDVLIDAFAIQSWEESKTVSVPAFLIYYAVIGQLLGAGVSVIADCNFHRGVSERDVTPLMARADCVLIHLQAPRDIATQRFDTRAQQAERRPSFDAERKAQIQAGTFAVSWEAYEAPLELDVPTLIVDTADGYQPDPHAIVDFVRRART